MTYYYNNSDYLNSEYQTTENEIYNEENENLNGDEKS